MANFEQAVEHLLAAEGGYADHPADPGGETAFGISAKRYPWVNITTLTREQAISLYREDFWHPLYQKLEPPLAAKLLEMTVNLPHGDTPPYYATDMTGIRLAQEALRVLGDREITVDGLFGPQTLQALRLVPWPAVLAAIRVEQVRYYLALADAQPELRTFFRGWIRRAVATFILIALIGLGRADGAPGPWSSMLEACRPGDEGAWKEIYLQPGSRLPYPAILLERDAAPPCLLAPGYRLKVIGKIT